MIQIPADTSIFSDVAHSLLVISIGGIAKLALDHRALETRQEALVKRLEHVEADSDRQVAASQAAARESGATHTAVMQMAETLDKIALRVENTAATVERIQGRMEERDRRGTSRRE